LLGSTAPAISSYFVDTWLTLRRCRCRSLALPRDTVVAHGNRIRPSRFVHVVYRTCRFDEMVRWYQTVFDVRVQHRDPALAFLTYDERKQTTRVETLVLRD
jgi:hypothetical protein